MKSARSLPVHFLLLLYILVSGTYQIAGAVSIVVAILDLRHQADQPFEVKGLCLRIVEHLEPFQPPELPDQGFPTALDFRCLGGNDALLHTSLLTGKVRRAQRDE